MDRTQLRMLLAAGPSRRFNILETTLRLQAEARQEEYLFKTSFLNRCVLFKHVAANRSLTARAAGKRKGRSSQTLLFLPYDPNRPGDGGEALVYSRQTMRRVLDARSNGGDSWLPSLEEDEGILDLLDELPALNPFLLREAFGRAGRPIPEPYLRLDPNITLRLRRRLEKRVRPLVLAAFGNSDQDVGDRLENMLDALLVPGRSADLRHLGNALQIEPDLAPEILSAWTGIAFFEDELDRLKPYIYEFAHWLAHDSEPAEFLGKAQRRELDAALVQLRSTVRTAWRDIRAILDEYRDSYIALVFEDRPGPFVTYLRGARQRYWRLADLFGSFEQAIYALDMYQNQHGRRALPARVIEEFVGFLGLTFHVEAKRGARSVIGA